MNNYPYTNGIIKSIENKIFDRNKIYKLISTNKKDLVQQLSENEYGTDARNLETLIESEMLKVKNLINELTPQKEMTDLFFLASDAQNIKVLYKVKYFSTSMKSENLQDMLVKTSEINPLVLEEAIINGNYQNLTKKEKKLLALIDKALTEEQTNSPRLLSTTIDNTMYQYFMKLSRPSKALTTYFTSVVDFTNMLSFIRAHNLNWKKETFEEMFIKGGQINLNVYLANYENFNNDKKQEEMLKNFSVFYNELLTKIIKFYLEKKNLNRLENDLDSLLMNVMAEFKNDSFDIGPMIYYYLEKTFEAKNIRLIYANQSVELNDLISY